MIWGTIYLPCFTYFFLRYHAFDCSMEENWGTFGLTLPGQTSAQRRQCLVYTNSNHRNKDVKYKNMHLIQEFVISAGWVCGTGGDGRGGTCPITQCPAQGGLLASDLAREEEGTCRMVGPGELEKAADVGAWKKSLASNKEHGLLITFNSAFGKKKKITATFLKNSIYFMEVKNQVKTISKKSQAEDPCWRCNGIMAFFKGDSQLSDSVLPALTLFFLLLLSGVTAAFCILSHAPNSIFIHQSQWNTVKSYPQAAASMFSVTPRLPSRGSTQTPSASPTEIKLPPGMTNQTITF